MQVDFVNLDLREQPVLMLKNASGDPIGTLGKAMNINVDIKFNETSVLEFDLPAESDGSPTPYYDAVIGMRIVELVGVGQFVLMNPSEQIDGDRIIKSCKGYSLEYEFTYKHITLETSTYNFWNPTTPSSTLMGIVLGLMPSWSLGYVDDALIGKYRTFDVSDENLYNFLKDTIQTSYNCIFDFDTYDRKINVISAASIVAEQPVFISDKNLGKELSIEENTEDIVTRLDVNGAEGVNIREVNPAGTNQIINLDYFMNTTNFSQALIDKYYEWKDAFSNSQRHYYNLSIQYALRMTSKATEEAKLTELEAELASAENQQAVTIQAIASNLQSPGDLIAINNTIAAKKSEISNQKSVITGIELQAKQLYDEMVSINDELRFQDYFTEDEYLQFDKYLKDGSVSESSFVVQETKSYKDADTGNQVANIGLTISGSSATYTDTQSGDRIYDMTGGNIVSSFVSGQVISAVLEVAQDKSFMFTAYLSNGQSYMNASEDDTSHAFPKACISMTGTMSEVTTDIAGSNTLGTFVTTVIESGYLYFTMDTSEYERRYVAWDLYEYGAEILDRISQPSYTFNITSANFLCLDDFIKFKNSLSLGEKVYIALSEEKTLAPICIGVKYSYEELNNLVLEFGNSYTSRDTSFLLADLLEQSVSMGKDVDLSKYNYSAFIDSGASTSVREFMNAALDVSKNAIISSKEQAITWDDTGIRLRKWRDEAKTEYDPKQIWMNNNTILMTKDNWSSAEIAIGNFYDENLGECWGIVAPNIVGTLLAGNNLVIESVKQDGGVAVFKVDAEGCFLHNSNISITSDSTNSQILLDPEHGIMIGKYPLIGNDGTVNSANQTFYADSNGNLTLKGTIYAENGEFTGKVTATSGNIGGCQISNGVLRVSNANITDLNASKITAGVLNCSNISVTNLSADSITTGTLNGQRVGDLNASQVTTGVFNVSRIPDLSADKITTGYLSSDRIDVSELKVKTMYADHSSDPVAITSSGNTTLYVGGDGSWNFSNTYIYAGSQVSIRRYGSTDNMALIFDTQNLTMRNGLQSTNGLWTLGTTQYPFKSGYFQSITLIRGSSLNSYGILIDDESVRPLSVASTSYLGTSSCPFDYSYANVIHTNSLYIGDYIYIKDDEIRPTNANAYTYLGTESYPFYYLYARNVTLGANSGAVNLGVNGTTIIQTTTSGKVGFFGHATSRQSVASLPSNNVATAQIVSKINELIRVLGNGAYGLINSN